MVDHTKMGLPALWRREPREDLSQLLGKLIEECNELGSIAARCMIHGLLNENPTTGRPNHEELFDEIADTRAMIELTINMLRVPNDMIEPRQNAKYAHKSIWLSDLRDAIIKEQDEEVRAAEDHAAAKSDARRLREVLVQLETADRRADEWRRACWIWVSVATALGVAVPPAALYAMGILRFV